MKTPYLSLANRLVRLAKQLDPKAQARIEQQAGASEVGTLGKLLINALDPDRIAHCHRQCKSQRHQPDRRRPD